jgi:hypothetical protein
MPPPCTFIRTKRCTVQVLSVLAVTAVTGQKNQGQDSVLGRWEGVTEGVTPVTEGVTGPLDLSHDLPRDLSYDLSPAKKRARLVARLVTDTLFPMADLAARWGVTPNTVSRRLAFLQIKPIRQGNYRFLTVEQLELANALHSHILSGQPMETFPRSQQEGEAMAIARRQTVKVDQAESAMALVAAMAAKLTPPADPLQQARRLKEAADLGLWLSNAEMAEVIGMAESTLRDKGHDYSPRPGFRLERKQDSSRRFTRSGVIWWRAVQEGAAPSAVTSPVTSRPVGFAGAIEARCQTISAAIELPRLPFG